MDEDIKQFNIESALYWAFTVECADLMLPYRRAPEDRYPTTGTEYRLMQRMRLGNVPIDVSIGRSEPHDDALTLAAIVSNTPEDLGGKGMAISIAYYSRSGLRPSYMPGAVPKIEPEAWQRKNQFGRMSKTEVIRRYFINKRVPHPKNYRRRVTRRIEVVEEYCPCIWNPSKDHIDSVRSHYQQWAEALEWIRDKAYESSDIEDVFILPDLPLKTPWIGGD